MQAGVRPEHAGEPVRIPCGRAWLHGDLAVPAHPRGLVLFAHGSGSSRLSSRNRQVAHSLQQTGLATLLFDLLTQDEEAVDIHTRHYRFDIPLLAQRMERATAWIDTLPGLRELPLGFFGASTGSAAALIAAARLGDRVGAVVSRGGRPDLVEPETLAAVLAPTLLLVGGDDTEVIALNRQAYEHLRCTKDLVIVPGATHLFEEPGTLERVCELAAGWFRRHLGG